MSGTICFLTYAIAIEYLPLAVFFVIMQSSPILIAFIAWIWLGEAISRLEIVCMIIAMYGIFLVASTKKVKDQPLDPTIPAEDPAARADEIE